MVDVKEITEEAQERVMSAVKLGQTAVVDGLSTAWNFAERFVPAQVTNTVGAGLERLPAVDTVVDAPFDFAEKVISAQRDFAHNVVDFFNGDEEPAPAKKPVAKKTTAKKPVAKKPAAKKPAAKKPAAKKPAAKKAA